MWFKHPSELGIYILEGENSCDCAYRQILIEY